MSSKGLNQNNLNALRAQQEAAADKALSSTLMEELQNIKDKFKNEDEEGYKGKFLFLFMCLSFICYILYFYYNLFTFFFFKK
jgi:hypothetical protein